MGSIITKPSIHFKQQHLRRCWKNTSRLTLQCFFWLTSLSDPSLYIFITVTVLFQFSYIATVKIYPPFTWVSLLCPSFLGKSSKFPDSHEDVQKKTKNKIEFPASRNYRILEYDVIRIIQCQFLGFQSQKEKK